MLQAPAHVEPWGPEAIWPQHPDKVRNLPVILNLVIYIYEIYRIYNIHIMYIYIFAIPPSKTYILSV